MSFVVGIDEAGRGPLAGPVAVGALCAPVDFDFFTTFPGLNDSKKLSEKKREALFSTLEELCEKEVLSIAVVFKSANDIDTRGIAIVIREAIAEALHSVMPDPSKGKVWLDGSLSAPPDFEQETVIGGDALLPAIMLASIAAKVTRDRYMETLARTYPYYGFERHKGYGTKAHIEALTRYGPSDIHRHTFIHI